MHANTTELFSYRENYALQFQDFFLRMKYHARFRPDTRPAILPLACMHQPVWLKNLACMSLILASLLWLPDAYADNCQGIHITGVIGGNAVQFNVLDNSLINDKYRDKMPNKSVVTIQNGTIGKATIAAATTCSIAANSAGEITALTLTGATLIDASIDGATVVTVDKTTLTKVDNIRGEIAKIDIVAHVEKAPAPDQQDDPLELKNATEIITLTKVMTHDKQEIPAKLSLHYADGKSGTYTLFTTTHPSQCWFFCCLRERPSEVDKQFGDKTFVIPAKELRNKILLRGWTTGMLVVPYKYTLASHSLAHGSLTIGPYAGYTTDVWGMSFTFPLAAGITKVTIPTMQDGAASTTDKFGLSIATGLLFKPGGNAGTLNTGVLLGVDQLGPNSGYADNGKLWLGIYVGAGF